MASAAGGAVASTLLGNTTAFRLHVNMSNHASDHDDIYRTVTLHSNGSFTDYNERLWDLSSTWTTEGVDRIVYGGTYTLNLPNIELHYTKIVSKCNDVYQGKEFDEVEQLDEPRITSGTLSPGGTSLAVKPFRGGEPGGAAELQTLAVGKLHDVHGGKYC